MAFDLKTATEPGGRSRDQDRRHGETARSARRGPVPRYRGCARELAEAAGEPSTPAFEPGNGGVESLAKLLCADAASVRLEGEAVGIRHRVESSHRVLRCHQ